MPKSGVQDLLHPVHFCAKSFLHVFDSFICVRKALVDSPSEIRQALVIDQKAHKDGEGWQSRGDGGD
jgi:hypothetical protein